MHFDASGIRIERNIVRNNYAGDRGGGIRLRIAVFSPKTIVRNNWIEGNRVENGGGGIDLVDAAVENNVILRNQALGGGGVSVAFGDGALIRNNTIVANVTTHSVGGAGVEARGGTPTLSHNIIAYNHAKGTGGGIGVLWVTNSPTVTCNDLWGNDIDEIEPNPIGSENFSADPVFCDASQNDYSLRSNSPCLPANNTCGAVGAEPKGCQAVHIEAITWGWLKQQYR